MFFFFFFCHHVPILIVLSNWNNSARRNLSSITNDCDIIPSETSVLPNGFRHQRIQKATNQVVVPLRLLRINYLLYVPIYL